MFQPGPPSWSAPHNPAPSANPSPIAPPKSHTSSGPLTSWLPKSYSTDSCRHSHCWGPPGPGSSLSTSGCTRVVSQGLATGALGPCPHQSPGVPGSGSMMGQTSRPGHQKGSHPSSAPRDRPKLPRVHLSATALLQNCCGSRSPRPPSPCSSPRQPGAPPPPLWADQTMLGAELTPEPGPWAACRHWPSWVPASHQVRVDGAAGTAQAHGLLVSGLLPVAAAAAAADGTEQAGNNEDASHDRSGYERPAEPWGRGGGAQRWA